MHRLAACLLALPGCYLIADDPDPGDCSEGRHLADPDGRGDRCIRDESTCDRPADCAMPEDACCSTACAETSSDTFECTASCTAQACAPGTCGEGFRCVETDGCPECVPDRACPRGQITVPDPGGSGAAVCIDPASECTSDQDCPEPDCGCWYECVDVGAGLYGCAAACDDIAEAPECWTDRDCVDQYGPGHACEGVDECYGGHCVEAAVQCLLDDDCAVAIDAAACCPCPEVFARTALQDDECLVPVNGAAEGPAPPDDADGKEDAIDPCYNSSCNDVDCPAVECADPGVPRCDHDLGLCVGDGS